VPRASIIGHNDIAPHHACFDGDEVAGVFDWDLAGPATPLMELAFIAWNWVLSARPRGQQLLALLAEHPGLGLEHLRDLAVEGSGFRHLCHLNIGRLDAKDLFSGQLPT
jgi:aminoglycoside phosphotransferase (APT) family kinase protein